MRVGYLPRPMLRDEARISVSQILPGNAPQDVGRSGVAQGACQFDEQGVRASLARNIAAHQDKERRLNFRLPVPAEFAI